ncbi:MAG: Ig-like domain-containing protein [Acetobacterium sp.]|uniref:Ig-like domain-containing protein n=1 Tax=Acetobacterium sp. TaxID=1872094 RepID=UPI003242F328
MKDKLKFGFSLIMLIFLCLPVTAAAEAQVGVAYRGHIENLGDYPTDGSWVESPKIIGTVGQSKRIEGFEIKLTGELPAGMMIRYNVHVENKGWLYDENDASSWPRDGDYAGTRGESLRIEAVKIVLTDADGQAVSSYSVRYRGHVQNLGELPADASQWLADGAQLGTVGSSLRLEALQVAVVKTAVDPPTPVSVVYDSAGTFGPDSGSETITGDVTVAADWVTLQNLVIAGNLTISEAVGDGTVTLNHVTVTGDTFVRGGGINSIHINGGSYKTIVMEKTASGAVRIVATDATGLAVVIAEDAGGETIILEGAFDSVAVNAPGMSVITQGTTTIGTMTVTEGAAGSTVTVAAGSTVSELVLAGQTAVKGQGTVAKAEVKVDGVVFDKAPDSYSVAPGVAIPPVFPAPEGGVGGPPPAPVAVTGVSLNRPILMVGVSEAVQLSARVQPATATNQGVSWTSGDPDIATVDATGKVSGVSEGSATITVTTTDGNKTAACAVTVSTSFAVIKTANGIGMITGMNGNSTTIEIPEMIDGLIITAIGAEAFKNCSFLQEITIPQTVTTIGSEAFDYEAGTAPASRCYIFRGDVPTIGAGAIPTTPTPTIKYYSNYHGYDDWTGCTKAHILAAPNLAAVTVINSHSSSVIVHWQPVSHATAYDIYCSETAGLYGYEYVSVAGDVFATPISDLDSSKSYYFAVKARDDYGESLLSNQMMANLNIPVTRVTVSSETATLIPGSTTRLEAQVEPFNAANKTIYWGTNNKDVATVDIRTGEVTGRAPGTAEIEALADNGVKGTCTVTVKPVLETLVEDDQVTITKCNGNSTYVTIPAQIEGKPVVAIGAGAFQGCEYLKRVTFDGSSQLAAIGPQAFQGCNSLEQMALPGTVRSIGSAAFAQCGTLSSMTLGAVETIGDYAFYECVALTDLLIPNSVSQIGEDAFLYCSGLKTLSFDGNAPTLAGNAGLPAGATMAYYAGATGFDAAPWTTGGYVLKYRNACLTTTTVMANTASFSFAAQTGASNLTLQQKITGATEWTSANLAAPLDASSTCATATTLVPGTHYDFQLLVTDGDTPGLSNFLSLTTPAAVDTVAIMPATLSLSKGGTYSLSATVSPADANQGVTWSSRDSEVVAVDPDTGALSAVSAGTATITATTVDGNQTATCEVTVLPYQISVAAEQVTITKYLGSDSSVTIPAVINGLPVVAIGEAAFEGLSGETKTLSTLIVEDRTVSFVVGLNAFRNQPLTSITMPANMVIIGEAATIGSNGSGFMETYQANGDGTYIWSDGSWRKQ